jgi:arsenite methyltransferase
MNTSEDIKKNVREKYSQIARGGQIVEKTLLTDGCCSPSSSSPSSCCGNSAPVVISMAGRYDQKDISAVPEGADLGLGCGTPVSFAGLSEGQTVLDLGSGAGIDVFIAAKYVGASGKVIGVDMTDEMICLGRESAQKVNAANVEFRLGEIEKLPVENDSIDRIISNCVINLVPSKENAFREMYRVLRPGGKFIISDIVLDGEISDEKRHDASLWAGCISGAIDRKEYLAIIGKTGFRKIEVLQEKKYNYPLENNAGIYSVTVTAVKEESHR